MIEIIGVEVLGEGKTYKTFIVCRDFDTKLCKTVSLGNLDFNPSKEYIIEKVSASLKISREKIKVTYEHKKSS